MTRRMKKRQYTAPTLSVVALRQQASLLAQSLDGNTTINVAYEEEDW